MESSDGHCYCGGVPLKPPRQAWSVTARRPPLDETDLAIINALLADGRMSVAALARVVGIPESTCAGRLRALRHTGVVAGIRAQVDLEMLGLEVQALVAVRMAGHDRARVDRFGDEVAGLPGVLAAYNVSGATDFVVHVAMSSPQALREFVLDHIASSDVVVHVETSMVFSTHDGRRPLAARAAGPARGQG